MKIEEIIKLTQTNFEKQKYNRSNIRKFLWHYALDELHLPDQDISKWVGEHEDDLKAGHELPAYRNFYLWYYCNYVPMRPEEGLQSPQLPLNLAGFKKELLITRYVVIKVKALVEEDSEGETIRQWESDCFYDLPGIEGFVVMETEFMGTTEIYPDLCRIQR